VSKDYKLQSKHVVKFAVVSAIGIFLFMALLPDGDGSFNIPLGFVINWLGGVLNSVVINDFGLIYYIAAILITVSFIMTVIAWTVKPKFIEDNAFLKGLFKSHPVYFVSKGIAVALVWMVYFGLGPDMILDQWDGAGLMMDLIAGSTGLMAIFIVLGISIPILTDFGIMEFLGVLVRKIVRFLFTLPGRSSIDLMGSWFSSSAAGVIITRDQHEKGFYTGREAASICVNFTFVSLPFTFVVANFIGLNAEFLLFYLIICITVIILAVIMPRIWPLRGIKDEYLPDVGKQIEEDPEPNVSLFSQATRLAAYKASGTTVSSVVKSGLSNWLSIFMDLIPFILAWGTIALVVNARTPFFDWVSLPFGFFMSVLGVEYAMEYAPATIVGFFDMFLPAVLLSGTEEVYIAGYGYVEEFVAPITTRFIIGALSIVQIIYLAETGILILKSKIPLNIGHLAILFLMRTVFALPIIVLLTRILFRG